MACQHQLGVHKKVRLWRMRKISTAASTMMLTEQMLALMCLPISPGSLKEQGCSRGIKMVGKSKRDQQDLQDIRQDQLYPSEKVVINVLISSGYPHYTLPPCAKMKR